MLCQTVLGYGIEYVITNHELWLAGARISMTDAVVQ